MSNIQTKVNLPQEGGSESMWLDGKDFVKMGKSLGLSIGGVIVGALVAYFSGIVENQQETVQQYGPVAGMFVVAGSTWVLNALKLLVKNNQKKA